MLEVLDINLNLAPTEQVKMLEEVGFTFMFAQNHHPAMKYIMPIRKSLSHRTIFNILGPLSNPAGVKKQLIGVFSDAYIVRIATALVDAIDLRKATFTKIAIMIVEYQYEFFQGGAIKPMKLDDLAGELDRHHSTISRAISNKYIACSRGVFPIKSFFALAVNEDNDTSNTEIKEYIAKIIKNEEKAKPLSDNKILALVESKFDIKLGRRTITKYRMALGLSSSSDRKKLYTLAV